MLKSLPRANIGHVAGLLSYSLWGLFPIYWKLLSHQPTLRVLSHRVLWSFVFYLCIYLAFSAKRQGLIFKTKPKNWALSFLAFVLLTANWGVYIYAVNTGHILEGSLAYFINPLLNVAVGVLIFKEKIPLILKISLALAALGVGIKILYSATFPWISIVLALTFCTYGVVKKVIGIPAIQSSLMESFLGIIPALLVLGLVQSTSELPLNARDWFLMIFSGLVTGLPLFLFSYAAQRVPYSMMGVMQFIAPSLQFLCGIVIYKEAFGTIDALSFGAIWGGALLYLTFQIYNLQKGTT